MRVISIKKLRDHWQKRSRADSEGSLKTWYREAKHANWEKWTDIKKQYRNASPLKSNRVVFNIHGNKYRLVVKMEYELQIIYIRFVGTHKEYDAIDAETV